MRVQSEWMVHKANLFRERLLPQLPSTSTWLVEIHKGVSKCPEENIAEGAICIESAD